MDGGRSVPLTGGEIHGFNTAADLDIKKLMEDASTRWLRPNEVHAILSNYTLLRIQPQPVDLPPSGTLLLFDRKMLRNFRKDGHNWRKKKDGKTVQEAHEKLKIGNEERIHVYYARNEDDPNFYRRCYWLLDKDLERIVLVHYRLTSEENANQVLPMAKESKEALHSTSSPVTPLNSVAVSSHSDMSDSVVVSDEINSIEDHAIYAGSTISSTGGDPKHGVRKLGLDELDRLGWEDIMEQPADIDLSAPGNGNFASADQGVEYQLRDSRNNGHGLQERFLEEMLSFGHPHGSYPNDGFAGVRQQNKVQLQQVEAHKNSPVFTMMNRSNEEKGQHITLGSTETTNAFVNNAFQYQSSFGRWNCVVDESCGSLDDSPVQCQTPDNHMLDAFSSTSQTSNQGKAFSIKDISPSWAYSEEETKIIVVGCFNKSYQHLEGSDVFCIFGGYCVPVEPLQVGVYRAKALPHEPGLVEFYLTLDGRTPISEVMNFEYRSISNTPSNSGLSGVTSPSIDSEMPKHKDLEVLIRLSHLLFSTSNCISAISSRISPNSLKEAKKFASQTSSTLESQWMHFLKLKKNDGSSYSAANHDLFELILKSKLQEWILLRVAEGSRTTPRDSHGQGVIHLCAILDYAWAIRLFALSNFSLDFRDARGWTALHWAAYYGRERTVAALLSARANPSLVTDPTPDNPGGCTAADLASQEGYEGLGAYLAEKGLQAHYRAMALSGNVSEPPPQSSNDPLNNENMESQNFSEQELCLKDSLAAYRNAADAADRIQAAFRERSHKQQMKAAQLENPEDEAKNIVAALKIQKAFRNYNRRKLMKAAVRIQGTFRTWQARKNFLNLRRQVIKIQAVFRGHQVRRQYHKICWSVGVLEKAVLRWRLKRKGLRGLQAESKNTAQMMDEDNCVEEDFYRVSREQAEDRVKRSVVRVQAMFRSYKAQQEYRRMKLAYNQVKMEFDDFEEY